MKMRNLFQDIRAIDKAAHYKHVGWNEEFEIEEEGTYDAAWAAEARKEAVQRWRRIQTSHPKLLKYDEFLDSEYWQNLSSLLKSRAGWKCQACGEKFPDWKPESRGKLQVHHKTYAHRGEEYPDHLEDLIVLCNCCHAKEHGK